MDNFTVLIAPEQPTRQYLPVQLVCLRAAHSLLAGKNLLSNRFAIHPSNQSIQLFRIISPQAFFLTIPLFETVRRYIVIGVLSFAKRGVLGASHHATTSHFSFDLLLVEARPPKNDVELTSEVLGVCKGTFNVRANIRKHSSNLRVRCQCSGDPVRVDTF